MESVLGFVRGAFVEMLQLLLVLAGAFFGAALFDVPGAAFFALFAAYSAFALYPARDLVEGWLGMVARRRPARYENRGENLGRALVALVPLVGLTVPVLDRNQPAEMRAFADAFYRFVALVFGAGTAVPRLWFVFRRGAEPARAAVPELLREAGRRGARLFYAAFVGLGLGIASVRAATPVMAAPRTPAPTPRDASESSLESDGMLCVEASESCPDHRELRIEEVTSGEIAILIAQSTKTSSELDWPRCSVSLPGGLRLSVPIGEGACSYHLRVSAPLPEARP